MTMKPGIIHGVGLGPGAVDLMSLRADRLVRETRHIAFFRKRGHTGRARATVCGLLRPDAVEFAMEYPVTTEIPLTDPAYNTTLSAFYEECTARLQALSDAGEDVAVLCEGDPFFYGSFMHLYERLKDSAPVNVVPAISGMSAAWTATGLPMTWGDDILSVLMATLPEAELLRGMQASDAIVVMKIGRNIDKVRSALQQAGRLEAAWLVEFASMKEQHVRPLAQVPCHSIPYFSIIIVHGQGRRP